jgi:GDP-mannose 6-dehydrogenase
VALRMVQSTGKSNIGIIGLAFKTGTDDLRESPMVRLVESLIGKGYNVKIYDRHVDSARIHGKNREYAIEHISHLSERMVPDTQLDQLFNFADVLVVGGSFPELRETLMAASLKKTVVDLVRIQRHRLSSENYQGICW